MCVLLAEVKLGVVQPREHQPHTWQHYTIPGALPVVLTSPRCSVSLANSLQPAWRFLFISREQGTSLLSLLASQMINLGMIKKNNDELIYNKS